jgi:hypothetical protein
MNKVSPPPFEREDLGGGEKGNYEAIQLWLSLELVSHILTH